jgi:hypothetical protein
MNLDDLLDSIPARTELRKEHAEAICAVLPTDGMKTLLGVLKGEAHGKMLTLTVTPPTDAAAIAQLQGEIAGMRRVFAILAEAAEAINPAGEEDVRT